jgi:hypothetical protein
MLFKLVHNGDIYEMLGLRCASLSAVIKVGAGQKGSHKHLNLNILYMMLPPVFYIKPAFVFIYLNYINLKFLKNDKKS